MSKKGGPLVQSKLNFAVNPLKNRKPLEVDSKKDEAQSEPQVARPAPPSAEKPKKSVEKEPEATKEVVSKAKSKKVQKEAPKKKAPKKKKRADDDDDEYEVELFDEEDDHMDDEEEVEESASFDKGKEEEEEEEEEEHSDSKRRKRSSPVSSVPKFIRSEEVRPLPIDQSMLAKMVTSKIVFDDVVPRVSSEPVFESNATAHAAFVKKLKLIDKNHQEADGGEEGPSLESPLASSVKRSGVKYTPLELQFLAVKEKHKDVVLFVECGYKYKFFGADAVIASNVLGIMCLVDKNFYVASVPVARLSVHMERLIVAGYKAGVVRQTETAALKAGNKESKNQIFTRELCEIYTTATFFGDAVVTQTTEPSYLTWIFDNNTDNITLVAISLRTSDLVFDSFTDNFVRGQLETRLVHLRPVEIVVSGAQSPATEALIKGWSKRDTSVRITRRPSPLSVDESRANLHEVYGDNTTLLSLMEQMLPTVVVGVACVGTYLKEYDLERAMMLVDGMRKWSRDEMLLSAETLRNLEVYGKSGSLYKHVDRTVSPMGSRLISHWIGHPLTSLEEIAGRQDAVEATKSLYSVHGISNLKQVNSPSVPAFVKLMQALANAGDIEQDLASIYHRRCKPSKFISSLRSIKELLKLVDALVSASDSPNTSALLLNSLLSNLKNSVALRTYIDKCLAVLDESAAAQEDWMNIFIGRLDEPVPKESHVKVGDGQTVSTIIEARKGIRACEGELQEHLKEIRSVLGIPVPEYKSVNGREYLVEVPRSNKKAVEAVPDDWLPDQHTKAMMRFQSPEAAALLLRLNMFREATVLLAKTKWTLFLDEFTSLYGNFRSLGRAFATLDCISAFALLASCSGYVRPKLENGRRFLSVKQGRHPVAETFATSTSFIGNDVELGQGGIEHLVVTGPNMGGKSTYIRGMAQIVILAQCGSFVPAESCEMGIFDAIFTRMGAEDDLSAGRSTFFSELLGASSILQTATDRSLVVMDELGRGTSTFDGTAIAYATLRYLAETIGCLSFFVTHYPTLGTMALTHPNVGNAHVAYVEGDTQDAPITFLFQVKPGLETRSYGLNVARLAFGGSFDDILTRAKAKSEEMEVSERRKRIDEFAEAYRSIQDAIDSKNPKRLKIDLNQNE